MAVDYKAIGRRIATQRKNKAVTQSVLAEKLDVSESFVSQVERGSAKVSLARLYEIAEALEIDIAQLVSNGGEAGKMHSEIESLIGGWTPEQREFLIELLIFTNNKMKSN